jgi:predicted GIY-YIG superfamily endonuclease
VCNVDGCQRKPHAKGYCAMHYKRFAKHGEPTILGKSGRPRNEGVCSIKGCSIARHTRGMCRRHYYRWWKYGEATAGRPKYTHLNNKATYVYRMYGTNDSLLYVGLSVNLSNRISNHVHEKEWADEVMYMKAELFPCRDSAKWAERQLVQRNAPKYNVLLRGE